MKLVISTFNYYNSIKARTLLEKCLCLKLEPDASNETKLAYSEFKIYAYKLIFNIFRANNLEFKVFFIDILLNSMLASELLNSEAAAVGLDTLQSDQFLYELAEMKFNFTS